MRLTLPYPPSVNNLYWTRGRKRVLKTEGRQYKANAAILAAKAGMRPLAGEVTVKMELHRPRRSGDVDNFSKIVLDSLKGIAWKDDGQVCEIHVRRFEDKLNPRVEIEIESA